MKPSAVVVGKIFGNLPSVVAGSADVLEIQKMLDYFAPHSQEPANWFRNKLRDKPTTYAADCASNERGQFDGHDGHPYRVTLRV
jgi:hypothetical protein